MRPAPALGPWSDRAVPLVVVVLWLLTAAGGLAMVIGTIVASDPAGGGSWSTAVMFTLIAIDALTCTTVGLLIVTRRPGNWVGWLLALMGAGLVLTFAGFALAGIRTDQAAPDDLLAGLLSWSGLVAFNPTFLLVGLIMVLFPDGRLPSARWKFPIIAVVATVLAGTSIFAIKPGLVDASLAVNPFGFDHPVIRALAPLALTAASLAAVAIIPLGALAVALRFRHARGHSRQQLKWFVGAVAIVAVFVIPGMSSTTLDNGSGEFGLFDFAGAASLALIPLAIGVAVLRYRLYDIDRLISRTVGWAVVTVILLAVFTIGVAAVEALLAGVTQGERLAVAASTLVAFALFQPLRRRVQRTVDRRFDRARYDATRVVESFSERLRYPLELATLGDEIARVANETVRPASAAVWLRHGRGTSRSP
jgi:hypothetical protein